MTNMTQSYWQAREAKKDRKFKDQVVIILFVLAILLFVEAIILFTCKLDVHYWWSLPITAAIATLFGFWFIKHGPIGSIEPTEAEIEEAQSGRKLPSVKA
jgi:cation transport ATPase